MKRILSAIAGVCVLLGGAICLPANAAISPLDLVNPVADYKIYVSEKLDVLVRDTKTFTDAIKAGDLAAAKKQYAPTRVSYETIEPIAELFSDLDSTIDSRADDHEKREADPGFIGFHRLEYGLFAKNSTNGLGPIADKLMADILDLRKRVAGLAFPPERVVGGAAALLEEVAATKVSGEEDRYSHTDLWDFQANIDGAKKIVDLFRPLIEGENEGFFKKVDANFATVDRILAKYKTPDGFKAYDSVTDRDRVALIGPVNTLAEDLSDLRGLLDLN
jgi:Predicted periplasmic lipoprotein involved in iron transport